MAVALPCGRAGDRGELLFCLLLPGVSQQWFQLFLDEFAKAVGEPRGGLVLDGAPSHRAVLAWPAGMVPRPLPPDCPELNPAEQVFRCLRAKLANQVFTALAALEAAITERLREFWDRPAMLRQLTAYPWWLQTLARMMPSTS